MNIVFDIGNTQVKVAVFDGRQLVDKEVFDDFSHLSLMAYLERWKLQACLVSSTRELDDHLFEPLVQAGVELFHLDQETALPITISYKTPETLGLDRVAAVAGAHAVYPDDPVLVIDMGTAITYDLITADGTFMGGNISPGMSIRFLTLHRFTDRLPLVEPSNEPMLIGTSTQTAIQAGVQNGLLYEIESHINALKNKYNGLKVILTGGASEYFVKKLKKPIFVNPNLVLNGLNHILQYQIAARRERGY